MQSKRGFAEYRFPKHDKGGLNIVLYSFSSTVLADVKNKAEL